MYLDKLIYRDTIKYQEFIAENDSNTSVLKPAASIRGLRLKGHYTFTQSESGDSATSDIVYRTKEKIPKHSKLDGHIVVESVRVDSHLPDAGYLNYCK